MIIDTQIYLWLLHLKIMEPLASPSDPSQKKSPYIKFVRTQLPELLTQQFCSGLKLLPLLTLLTSLLNQQQNPKFQLNVKDTQLVNQRENNWNGIQRVLNEMGVRVDERWKKEIVLGDLSSMNKILKMIKKVYEDTIDTGNGTKQVIAFLLKNQPFQKNNSKNSSLSGWNKLNILEFLVKSLSK